MIFSSYRRTREVYLDLGYIGNPSEEPDPEQEADLPEEFQIESIEQISSIAGLRSDVVRRFKRRMILCAELGGALRRSPVNWRQPGNLHNDTGR